MHKNKLINYLNKLDISYFKIDNGQIYSNWMERNTSFAKKVRTEAFINYISPIIKENPNINTEFLFCYEDALPLDKYKYVSNDIPYFTYSINKSFFEGEFNKNIQLIPNYDIQVGLLDDAIKKVELCDDPYDFKMQKGIFVGSSTGNGDRMLFCEMAIDSKYVNAYISNIVQMSPERFIENYDPSILSQSIPLEIQLQYKYLINIDGNASTYSRIYWQHISNSRVIQFGLSEPYIDLMGYYEPIKSFEEVEDIIKNDKEPPKSKFYFNRSVNFKEMMKKILLGEKLLGWEQ